MQDSGLCVVADKLNFVRYLSHFRCVHRGADFAKMRTTTVRRLLPESWGFLCPVHTPDGAPCGLLNHLTAVCEVVTKFVYTASIPALLCGLGRNSDSAEVFLHSSIAGVGLHSAVLFHWSLELKQVQCPQCCPFL